MEIKIVDDGKEKAQSFEASFELWSESNGWGNYNARFDGYGVDKWSAEQNLVFQAIELRKKLDELIKKYS